MIEARPIIEPQSLDLPIIGRLFILVLCLTIVGLLIAPFAYFIMRNNRIISMSHEMRRQVGKDFEAFVGKPVLHVDYAAVGSRRHANAITGTGIAYDGEDLYLLDDGIAARVPWHAVRSWQTHIAGYEQTKLHGGGAASQFTNSVDNQEARARAYQKSGLFIRVADIEMPEWQFMTMDEKILNKWAEILTQIEEGRKVA